MPLVTNKPNVPVELPVPIQVAKPELKTNVVDTRYVPTSSLLTYIEGSSWISFYYSQVLNDDNALMGQQSSGDSALQSYRLIKHLELKVTSPLQTNQDPNSNRMDLTGTSYLYPFIIPNVGDMFVADVGDGREGIFRITNTSRKTIFNDACYEIEYLMVDLTSPMLLGDLNSKVVLTYEYVRDFLQHGQNPLVQEEEYKVIVDLVQSYHGMLLRFFKQFTSKEYRTLLLPSQGKPTYDHSLTKAVMSYYDTFQAPEIRTVRIMNCDEDNVLATSTLWDVLTQRNLSLLTFVCKRVGLVSTQTFTRYPKLEGIRYSGITNVVYPLDYEQTVDIEINMPVKVGSPDILLPSPDPVLNLNDIITQSDLEETFGPMPAVMIKKVTVDDYYIFSQAFYDGDKTNQSLLELCVTDYLHGLPVEPNKLKMFCKAYKTWGLLEQFYYIPIILVLIKANVRSV